MSKNPQTQNQMHKNEIHVGFFTGIPQVGFSDTVPVQPQVQYLQVMGTVSYETRSVGGTRGFLVLFNIIIY